MFTGAYAINPVNGERIADLDRRLCDDALRHRRDHGRAGARQERLEFAQKYDLPIIEVISACGCRSTRSEAYNGDGVLVNSAFLNGLNVTDAKERIEAMAEENGNGKEQDSTMVARLAVLPPALLGGADSDYALEDGTVVPVPECAAISAAGYGRL